MDKFWLKNYPKGAATEISVEPTDNITKLFDNACTEFADKKALTCHGVSISYKKTKQLVDNLAANLQSLGVKKGDRVAVMMPNLIQYPLAIFAALQVGGVAVNINPLYKSDEIDYALSDATPKVLFVLDVFADRLNSIRSSHPDVTIVVTSIGDVYPFMKASIFQFALKYIKREIKPLTYKHLLFKSLLRRTRQPYQKVNLVPSDLAFLQYTGATTGRPKGAMLSHGNIVANVKQITNWLESQMSIHNQVIIAALPMYHIFSLTANLFTFILFGNEIVMIPNARDSKDVIKTLKNTPFTAFNALDTLYHKLLSEKSFMEGSYPHFKYSVSGGMAIREQVAREWFDKTGVMPANCYGLTETSPAVTISKFDNVFTGACGYPIASTIVEIRGIESGLPLAQGETGVIWVSGPQVMSGYWNNPVKTVEALIDGFFNTGDVGYLDEEGRLHISSRITEMIIVSGFNVYPAEVEQAVNTLSEVKECAVVGAPDDDNGERVWAFVVLNEGAVLSEKAIYKHCKSLLAGYKVPRSIRIIDELPKSNVGKVLRKDLVSQYIVNAK